MPPPPPGVESVGLRTIGDEDDYVLLIRRWRVSDNMGREEPWEYEIGEAKESGNSRNDVREIDSFSVSNSNPCFCALAWRH